jgi:hypothetical protein
VPPELSWLPGPDVGAIGGGSGVHVAACGAAACWAAAAAAAAAAACCAISWLIRVVRVSFVARDASAATRAASIWARRGA